MLQLRQIDVFLDVLVLRAQLRHAPHSMNKFVVSWGKGPARGRFGPCNGGTRRRGKDIMDQQALVEDDAGQKS